MSNMHSLIFFIFFLGVLFNSISPFPFWGRFSWKFPGLRQYGIRIGPYDYPYDRYNPAYYPRDCKHPDRDHDYPHHDHDHPSHDKDYPSRGHDYPGRDKDYPSHGHDYPGRDKDYPSGGHDYPGRNKDYPSRRPDYPGRDKDYPSRDKDYPNRGHDYPPKDYDQPDAERYVPNQCACLTYVEDTVVFRRVDSNRRYSCDRRGLNICSEYCNNLFEDENIQERSRQDACDILGREINTSWYRKNRVCGQSYREIEIPIYSQLCCEKGRPVIC